MIWFWIIAVLLVSSVLEYWLSYRRNKWYGLILPVLAFIAASVFLALNLLNVFPEMEIFGSFLVKHGNVGLVVVILKSGFLYTPAALLLINYLVCRHLYNVKHNPAKHNKEYKKMLADDL